MTHDNRGRITVDKNGDWRLYVVDQKGFTPLGTVTHGGETGALMRNEQTGIYVQMVDGTSKSLDGRKVAAALGVESPPVGAPRQIDGKRVNVYLDTASLEAAAQFGDGNVSEGIRRALASISGATPRTA
jgi:hypothetical protein